MIKTVDEVFKDVLKSYYNKTILEKVVETFKEDLEQKNLYRKKIYITQFPPQRTNANGKTIRYFKYIISLDFVGNTKVDVQASIFLNESPYGTKESRYIYVSADFLDTESRKKACDLGMTNINYTQDIVYGTDCWDQLIFSLGAQATHKPDVETLAQDVRTWVEKINNYAKVYEELDKESAEFESIFGWNPRRAFELRHPLGY